MGAPTVDSPGELTNLNPLIVSGTAEASATVQIRGGAEAVVETTATGDGSFEVSVPLRADAENTLLVSQVVDGSESPSAQVTVTHDGMPPAAPDVDPPASPTRLTMVTLRGSAEAGATVTVTGGLEDATGIADGSGSFELDVELETSASAAVDNELAVVATDAAGNASAATTVAVTFDPNLSVEAPMIDDVPDVTNEATITLSGIAETGVGISAVGGATDGSTTVAVDGTWSVDVGLRPNRVNTLLVFAVSGSDTSPAATLTVRHDDIAPLAPTLDAQASPTGAELARITGLSEGGAALEITGGAATATGTADEVGGFSIDVMLTADATNELSVVATDAAGNASDPATLTLVQDSTLEAPIVVDPVASPTSDATVSLSGTAAAMVDIEISGGASTVMTSSDATGAWSAEVDLNPNAINELRLTRPSSGVDTLVTIEHDGLAPDAPTLNPLASPTGNTSIVVSGTTEARARVSVSGATMPAAVTAGADGRFDATVVIAEDVETALSVISTDRAGNSSSPATVSVTHSGDIPDAPTLDETNPAPTSMPMFTVTGTVAEPGEGVMVRVTGGASAVTEASDPMTGVFSATVTLTANTANELAVVSVNGAIESAAAVVTVVHDDIAPAAPEPSSLSASASTCVGTVTTGGNVAGSGGSVEARATVRVENVSLGREVTTTATDGGSFSVSIGVCGGDVIRVTAIDAAGNEGASTEITAS